MDKKKRSILIFPEFENMAIIDELRAKYDPAVLTVRPHITLVFPFESDMSSELIYQALRREMADFSRFPIELQGITKVGQWLFLRVRKGGTILRQMHDRLYSKEFSEYKPQWDQGFLPHLTIGSFQKMEDLEVAFSEISGHADLFSTQIDKITVEIIGENNHSSIESEIILP